jgi:hypothetical protein
MTIPVQEKDAQVKLYLAGNFHGSLLNKAIEYTPLDGIIKKKGGYLIGGGRL